MENLTLVELPTLMDLLAEETTRYMKMVSTGATKEDFEKCQQKMKKIQQEIIERKPKVTAIPKDRTDA